MQIDCQNLIPLVQLLARLVMMSFVSAGAILCIYWGWRLYTDCVVSKVSGEIQYSKIKGKFVAAGPGIVLAGFGAWLLSLVASHPFEFKVQQELTKPSNTSAISALALPVDHGLLKVQLNNAAGLPPTKSDISERTTAACKCNPFRLSQTTIIRNMAGNRGKEPTDAEILRSLEIAMSTIQSGLTSKIVGGDDGVLALESLDYLRALAKYHLSQTESSKSTEPQKQ